MKQFRYILPETGAELLVTWWEDDSVFGQAEDPEVALRPRGARTWGPPLEPVEEIRT